MRSAQIVIRLLEKEPAARFQTALELRAASIAAGASVPTTLPGTSAVVPRSEPVRYTGPEAFGATTAPTTGSGAAAQVVAPPATTAAGAGPSTRPARRSAGYVIGGLLLVAAAAAGTFVALRGDEDAPAPAAGERVAASPPPAAPSELAPAAAIAPPSIAATEVEACPEGQIRGDDTQGRCCWPEQAWSSARARCVGAPSCPAGTEVRDEACVAIADEVRAPRPRAPRPVPVQPAATRTSQGPMFRVDATSYAPRAPIAVRFSSPIPSTPTSRAWITLVEPAKSASSYGPGWSYLDDGATTATLRAPTTPGTYEIRLHTDYPAKRHHIRHRVQVTVTEAAAAPSSDRTPTETPPRAQRFRVTSTTVVGGEQATVVFAAPMHAEAGQRFWITVVERSEPDTRWSAFAYLSPGVRRMQLAVPTTAGDYEIRLHANYPRHTTNVVHRVGIQVVDRAPAE